MTIAIDIPTDPATPAATTTRPSTTFPVRLVDIDGHTLRHDGLILPLDGDQRPAAIRVDGQLYVDTGAIVGSGHTVTRHIYRRQPSAAFVANVGA